MSAAWLQPLAVALTSLWLVGVCARDLSGDAQAQNDDRGRALAAQAPSAASAKDLSGVWRNSSKKVLADLTAAGEMPPMQPWAATLFKERVRAGVRERPSARCLPRGLPGAMLVPEAPWKIVQTPGVVVLLFGQSLHYRQILTDGRALPGEIGLPSWLGYSIGIWEGDTLVVQTIGLTDQTWLDDRGHPHSSEMRVTERFRRRSRNRLEVQVTLDDAKTYVRPWRMTFAFDLRPESDLIEDVCAADAVH